MEVIFSSDSDSKADNCVVWSMDTGSIIATFKGETSSPKTLAQIRDDYLISGVVGKPHVKVWTLGKSCTEESKFILPGTVTALTVTACGTYCIAAIETMIHVWKVSTGDLLSVVSSHYKDISCLKLSDDGSYLVSAGKDCIAYVWQLSGLLNHGDVLGNIKPLHTWNEHSAEITDVFIGANGSSARVATVSIDSTGKIYELASGDLLYSVVLDIELFSVVMDPAEYYLMIGDATGSIFKINIFSRFEKDVQFDADDKCPCFKGHSAKVSCLSVSMEGTILLSGSDDKTCKLWSIENMICLKTFSHAAPVTNAFITMAPYSLVEDCNFEAKLPILAFSRCFTARDDSFENKLTPFRPDNHNLTTYSVNEANEEFNKTISCGMNDPGSVNKETLINSLGLCETINNQLFSYSLKSLMLVAEESEAN